MRAVLKEARTWGVQYVRTLRTCQVQHVPCNTAPMRAAAQWRRVSTACHLAAGSPQEERTPGARHPITLQHNLEEGLLEMGIHSLSSIQVSAGGACVCLRLVQPLTRPSTVTIHSICRSASFRPFSRAATSCSALVQVCLPLACQPRRAVVVGAASHALSPPLLRVQAQARPWHSCCQ